MSTHLWLVAFMRPSEPPQLAARPHLLALSFPCVSGVSYAKEGGGFKSLSRGRRQASSPFLPRSSHLITVHPAEC
jgi:hypothetical protein